MHIYTIDQGPPACIIAEACIAAEIVAEGDALGLPWEDVDADNVLADADPPGQSHVSREELLSLPEGSRMLERWVAADEGDFEIAWARHRRDTLLSLLNNLVKDDDCPDAAALLEERYDYVSFNHFVSTHLCKHETVDAVR